MIANLIRPFRTAELSRDALTLRIALGFLALGAWNPVLNIMAVEAYEWHAFTLMIGLIIPTLVFGFTALGEAFARLLTRD